MTSIEWLENELKKSVQYYLLIEDIVKQAKEIHKQEIIDAWEMGRFNIDEVGLGEEYYQETFVSKVKIKFTEEEWSKLNNESKGSNEITGEFYLGGEIQKIPIDYTTFQQEISDEEIEKAAAHHEPMVTRRTWISACKWYREQIKK